MAHPDPVSERLRLRWVRATTGTPEAAAALAAWQAHTARGAAAPTPRTTPAPQKAKPAMSSTRPIHPDPAAQGWLARRPGMADDLVLALCIQPLSVVRATCRAFDAGTLASLAPAQVRRSDPSRLGPTARLALAQASVSNTAGFRHADGSLSVFPDREAR